MNQYFKLPKKLVDKENIILNLCKDKRVLHLGCVDYPLLYYRIKSGTWLHGKIMQAAKKVIGIDNAKNEVEILKEKYNIDNIFYGDVEKLIEYDFLPFNIVIAGEIIEHLSNPGLFLDTIKRFLLPDGILIITTVNAFCLRRIIRIPLGIESVHPDHKYYFSHSTLSTLLKKHDYTVQERYSYRLPKRSPWIAYYIELLGSIISPNLTEGIVYIVKKKA
ncbi:Ubiquinone biosynthesis O-methyltransferase [subsurface metagenome]